jgi:myo-inositol 2-dehydrogenase / D-chiro-inositol 1-dehydrogenase
MGERSTAINAVIIGAGRRGRAHGRAAISLPGVRIAAVCDADEERARGLAEELGGRPSTDWRLALDERSPQLVYVTSPPPVHAEQTIAALEAGSHVVLEKPIALTMAEAAAIGEAARRTGRHVQVCQQHRYGLLADRARSALAGRRIALAHSWLYRQTPDIPGNWNRSWGGGHIVEWGIHHLDLLRYLIGEIEAVSATYGEQVLAGRPGWSNWDAYSVSFRFAGGAVGSMATTYAAWPGLAHASGLDLIAEGVVLRYEGSGLQIVTPEGAETVRETRDSTLELNRAFVIALQTGDWSPVRIPYPDAVRTLAVVLAANRSNETGQTVRVDDLLADEGSQRVGSPGHGRQRSN